MNDEESSQMMSTKLDLAESALRRNEERLRMALEAAQMGTFEWDTNTGRILWKDGTERIFGFLPGTFPETYQEMENRIHPDDRQLHRDELERARESRTTFKVDFRIVWPDGSIHWISRHGHYHYDAAGKPFRMVGVVMDVTPKKELENALKESNRRFEATLNTVSDLFVSFDAQWHYTFLNEQAAAFTGHLPHELMGKNIWEVFPEAIGSPFWKALHDAAANSRLVILESYYEDKHRWYEHRAYPNHAGVVVISTDITTRKQVEAELRQSEAHFLRLLAKLPIAAYTCATDGTITYFNEQAARLWGRVPKLNDTLDRFCGSFKLFTPEGNPLSHQDSWMGKALLTGAEYYGEELTIERPDGTRAAVLAHVSQIHDESGNHLGAVNLLVDVTERKQAQQRLFFKSFLLDQVRNAVIATDMDGKITFWNRFAESLYQWKATEVLGKKASLLVPEEFRESGQRIMQEVARTGFWEGVFTVRRKDGATFPAYVTDAALKDENGNHRGYVGVSEDFTKRQSMEETLRQSERRLAEAQRAAHIGSWERDLQTNQVTWSEETYRLFGEEPSQEQKTYESFLAGVLPEDVQRIRPLLHEAIMDRQPFCYEYRVRTPTGDIKVLQDRGDIILDDAGKPIRLVGTVQDITERKRIEAERESLYQQVLSSREELRVLSRRLIQTQEEERRRLARELHDEIGQVLTAVSLSLELALGTVDAAAKERLQESMAVVDRAIDQVRGMSLNLRPAMLDVMGLESALRWFTDRQMKTTGVKIDLVCSLGGERLPPELETACFRIIQESLTNVARHAEAHNVRLELTRRGAEVLLSIQDDGTGFDAAAARRHATTGGSFGLLGMEERARLLGGSFEIDSAVGHGTTVRVRLPLNA